MSPGCLSASGSGRSEGETALGSTHSSAHLSPRSEWHVTAHPGGPVPAPGLCGRQQPPSHAELALGGKTPESLPALSPRGPGDTPCRGRRWRESHLPSSAPTGLPASFLQPLCEMSAIVQSFEHSLALPLFGIGMKTVLFQFCGHCRVFQICWHIECSTFTASSFRI